MKLAGSFAPPGDKSISHRLALMSLLAEGNGSFTNMAPGADVRSSLTAVHGLGSQVEFEGGRVHIRGGAGLVRGNAVIDCGNSGTTMRLLMGILAGREGSFTLDGDASLRRRPMERVAGPLRLMGAGVTCTDGKPPVEVRGGSLRSIDFTLPVASAQLKSAVLLAGTQATGTTVVREPLPSRDHTERLLELFGGRVARSKDAISVEASPLRMPGSFRVPGDPSSAAFFLCAASILPGSEVTAEDVLLNPTRIGFLDVLHRMGVKAEVNTTDTFPEPRGTVTVRYTDRLSACEIKAGEIPSLIDEVPILALTATRAHGATVFHGVGELRVKETDRLTAIVEQLTLLGGRVEASEDSLTVHGPTKLVPAPLLRSYGDHRMAMTLRLAGLLCDSSPSIEEEGSAAISYPNFGETLEKLLQ